jgi:hypothetical protein
MTMYELFPALGINRVALPANHRVTVLIRREVIPIVFVPGIMGSRLLDSDGNRAWDPDNSGFMRDHFQRANAAQRLQILVQNAPLQPDLHDADHNQKFRRYPGAAGRGWGGVSWGSYGPLLRHLSDRGTWDRAVSDRYLLPVHAFGYDWTASNRESGARLKRYIEETIQHYRVQDHFVEGVILVTHSMGGLVARAACALHGAAPLVHGVIHGVQPATGSPAAYWRMRAGMPRPSLAAEGFRMPRASEMLPPGGIAQRLSRPVERLVGHIVADVLGQSGREVTALLGNMAGGLELLPNRRYGEGTPFRRWLHAVGPAGQPKRPRPATGDPYEEIYLERTAPHRLIHDPAWLLGDPAAPPGAVELAWERFRQRIEAVRQFHDDLDDGQHPLTFHLYGTGHPTAGSIRFRARRVRAATRGGYPRLRRSLAAGVTEEPLPRAAAACRRMTEAEANEGRFVEYHPIPRGGRTDYPLAPDDLVVRVEMERPADDGDETVPECSGRALVDRPGTRAHRSFAVEHEPAYRDESVQRWTVEAIRTICAVRLKAAIAARDEAAAPADAAAAPARA